MNVFYKDNRKEWAVALRAVLADGGGGGGEAVPATAKHLVVFYFFWFQAA